MKNKKMILIESSIMVIISIILLLFFLIKKDYDLFIPFSLLIPMFLLSLSYIVLDDNKINNENKGTYLFFYILYLIVFGIINLNFSRFRIAYLPFGFLCLFLIILGILKYKSIKKDNEKIKKVVDIMTNIIIIPYVTLFAFSLQGRVYIIIFTIVVYLFFYFTMCFNDNYKRISYFLTIVFLSVISWLIALTLFFDYGHVLYLILTFVFFIQIVFNLYILFLNNKIIKIKNREMNYVMDNKITISFITINAVLFFVLFISRILAEYI